MWLNIHLSIIAAISLSFALNVVFTFLAVPYEDYVNWIIWMDCLVVFYILLPGSPKTIFQ